MQVISSRTIASRAGMKRDFVRAELDQLLSVGVMSRG
jgi:hypothetical protein